MQKESAPKVFLFLPRNFHWEGLFHLLSHPEQPVFPCKRKALPRYSFFYREISTGKDCSICCPTRNNRYFHAKGKRSQGIPFFTEKFPLGRTVPFVVPPEQPVFPCKRKALPRYSFFYREISTGKDCSICCPTRNNRYFHAKGKRSQGIPFFTEKFALGRTVPFVVPPEQPVFRCKRKALPRYRIPFFTEKFALGRTVPFVVPPGTTGISM